MTDFTPPVPPIVNEADAPQELFRDPRSIARIAAVQALYQITVSQSAVSDVIAEFIADHLDKISDVRADQSHFVRLAKEAAARQSDIDAMISAALAEGWTINRLDGVSLNILRAGITEIICFGSIPKAVIINEYVNVAHAFLDERQAAFINGVLDRIAANVRET